MTEACLKLKLRKHLKRDVELVINENRSTMLSLQKKRNRLSLHKMFLDAPDHVIAAIAHYIRGSRRKSTEQNLVLRGYIQENLSRFDCSHRLKRANLVQKGEIYDLQPLYDELNTRYFEGALDLGLTWFGARRLNSRSRITFGLYQDNLRLVKMHRILDDPFVPEFFVRFILYHEMVHAIVPGYVDERGHFRIHGREFKERERQFEHYRQAVEWEKKNKMHFFRG